LEKSHSIQFEVLVGISPKEALIDRDVDVFDPNITFSPISVSQSNLDDIKGNGILFLEVV
jgi:hypothetical protein